MFQYNIKNNSWQKLVVRGKPPGPRCYHEMKIINRQNFVVFGGIKGTLINIESYYNDIFLYDICNNHLIIVYS